jgi:hypothetical protein
MKYVVDRIVEENLYEEAKSNEEEHERYIKIAQKSRDTKTTAGSARTGTQRLEQGNAYKEIEVLGERVCCVLIPR